jgi:hypothetical protein
MAETPKPQLPKPTDQMTVKELRRWMIDHGLSYPYLSELKRWEIEELLRKDIERGEIRDWRS